MALRGDFTAMDPKRPARESQDAEQIRRLRALAVIHDGGSRAEAAQTGVVGRRIVRDRVERFNAGGPDALIDRKAPGNPSKRADARRTERVRIVESGPIPARDGVVRWRLIDPAAWVRDAFGVPPSEATMSRDLKALGFGKLSARARHHARNEEAIAAFEKTSPLRLAEGRGALPSGTAMELWFQE